MIRSILRNNVEQKEFDWDTYWKHKWNIDSILFYFVLIDGFICSKPPTAASALSRPIDVFIGSSQFIPHTLHYNEAGTVGI